MDCVFAGCYLAASAVCGSIAKGTMPGFLGLWWLLVPLLAFATWLYMRDGSMKRPRAKGAAA